MIIKQCDDDRRVSARSSKLLPSVLCLTTLEQGRGTASAWFLRNQWGWNATVSGYMSIGLTSSRLHSTWRQVGFPPRLLEMTDSHGVGIQISRLLITNRVIKNQAAEAGIVAPSPLPIHPWEASRNSAAPGGETVNYGHFCTHCGHTSTMWWLLQLLCAPAVLTILLSCWLPFCRCCRLPSGLFTYSIGKMWCIGGTISIKMPFKTNLLNI